MPAEEWGEPSRAGGEHPTGYGRVVGRPVNTKRPAGAAFRILSPRMAGGKCGGFAPARAARRFFGHV